MSIVLLIPAIEAHYCLPYLAPLGVYRTASVHVIVLFNNWQWLANNSYIHPPLVYSSVQSVDLMNVFSWGLTEVAYGKTASRIFERMSAK